MITIQQIERLRNPFYQAFSNAWANLLFSEAQPFIHALHDPQAINYIETIPIDIKEVQTLFLKTWIIPGRFFGKQTVSEYHKSVSMNIRTKGIEDDYFDKYMYDYAINNAGSRITSISNTNRDAILKTIRQSILEGEKQGMGAVDMAKYIQETLKEQMTIISRYSAERIARTEIVGSSNRGQLLGAQSLGYTMQKSWMPFIDSATRTFEKGPFNHAIEETVGLHDDYIKTGEPMQHPGDPHGSAGNVINCRCSQGFKVL